jgi:hypothetical protein
MKVGHELAALAHIACSGAFTQKLHAPREVLDLPAPDRITGQATGRDVQSPRVPRRG